MKTRSGIGDITDTLKQDPERVGLRASWRIPVPPTHEHCLMAALAELRTGCAQTSTQLVPPQLRPRFERDRILAVYDRVGQELTWLLRSWGMTQRLPEFGGARQTAKRVRALLEQTASSFEPASTLLHAARASCLCWVLRHIGMELLAHAWCDESFDWLGRLGPQSYPHANEFPTGIWDLATGRAQDDAVLIEPFAQLRADDGLVVRDPDWARLALRGEFQESFWGQLPSLPLVAWASAHGWPNRLWERVEAAGLGCGPWTAEEREIRCGELGDDNYDPFDD